MKEERNITDAVIIPDNLTLELEVRGSHPIKFQEGWKTGDMKKGGVHINTVWYQDGGKFGGCINREEAKQLRDFLNECINLWEKPLLIEG